MPVFIRSGAAWVLAGTAGGTDPPDPGDFVLGTTLPSATNTGHTAALINGTLVGYTQVFNTTGQVISNKRIESYVRVTAPNVVFDNCEFVGPATYTSYPSQGGFISLQAASCLLNRCTVKQRDPAYYTVAVDFRSGSNGSILRRCNVSQGTDLIGIDASNLIIEGNWLHDQVFFDGQGGMANGKNGSDHASDSRWPGWEHGDIAQIYSGDNNRFTGNLSEAFFITTLGTPNTAINGIAATGTNPDGTTFNNGGRKFPQRNYLHGLFIGPEKGRITNLRIQKNWFGGGELCLQFSQQGSGFDTGNSALVDGNRFRLDGKGGGYRNDNANPHQVIDIIAAMGTTTVQGQGNVWDDHTSVPLVMRGTAIDGYRSGTSQLSYSATI